MRRFFTPDEMNRITDAFAYSDALGAGRAVSEAFGVVIDHIELEFGGEDKGGEPG